MLKSILGRGLIGALAMLPLAAGADDDARHPAYDFKPKVIYKDLELVASSGAKFDPKFPAAYFEPKVIFQDKDLIEKLRASCH
jgi:hypothetical protein